MLTFESIEAQSKFPGLNISRAKVPGGWLVMAVSVTIPTFGSVTFVPDVDHTWDGSSLSLSQTSRPLSR
jgi:hypothetical protein